VLTSLAAETAFPRMLSRNAFTIAPSAAAATMKPAEPLHLPVIPHRKAGVNCNSTMVPEQGGEHITLRCNASGAVLGPVNARILVALAASFRFRPALESCLKEEFLTV
jgi:hypothetical protein